MTSRLLAIALMPLPHLAAAEWERLASLPEPVGGCVHGAVGGAIVIAGGTNWEGGEKHWLDRIRAYDPRTNAWRDAGRLDAPLAYAVSAEDAGDFYFASGSTGTATHRALWKMSADFSVKKIAALDAGFVYAGGAIVGRTLYVVGGSDDQARYERFGKALLAISLDTGATERLADYPEAAFSIGAVAACGGGIHVFGGARWDAAADAVANMSAAHAYSLAEKRWKPLPPLPRANRGIGAVTLDERHILLAGGYTSEPEEFTAATYLFDTTLGTYTPSKPLPWAGMVGLVKSGDWLYCIAGEDAKAHRTDAMFRIRWRELLVP